MYETEDSVVKIGPNQINLTNPNIYGRGWNAFEEYGCWSRNYFSEVNLLVAPEVQELDIEFSFVLLEKMPRPQIFRLWVDRTCLVNEIINEGTERHCVTSVSREHFDDGLLKLKFYLSFLRLDENQMPLSGDPRRLGLKLFRLVAVGQ